MSNLALTSYKFLCEHHFAAVTGLNLWMDVMLCTHLSYNVSLVYADVMAVLQQALDLGKYM